MSGDMKPEWYDKVANLREWCRGGSVQGDVLLEEAKWVVDLLGGNPPTPQSPSSVYGVELGSLPEGALATDVVAVVKYLDPEGVPQVDFIASQGLQHWEIIGLLRTMMLDVENHFSHHNRPQCCDGEEHD